MTWPGLRWARRVRSAGRGRSAAAVRGIAGGVAAQIPQGSRGGQHWTSGPRLIAGHTQQDWEVEGRVSTARGLPQSLTSGSMMERTTSSVAVSFCALFALVVALLAPGARAQSTAFTFQGQLNSSGAPAQGVHDLRFRLFDAVLGGTQLGATQCADNVPVVDGVFTTTIDFGAQFTSTGQRFIEIDVRRDTGLGCESSAGFLTLGPRQPVTAAPTAVHAKSA